MVTLVWQLTRRLTNLPGTRAIADHPLVGLFDLVLWPHVPQDDCMITAARGKDLTIRAEGEAFYKTCMTAEWLADCLARFYIPQDDRAIDTS
jgi:hypothetical protein